MRNVGKGAIAVVMKQYVMPPEGAKQVVPAIVVIIAHADTGLPTGAPQSRFLGHIGKGAVAVVLVEVSGRFLPWRPMRVEPIAIGKVNVQPPVLVVVEKGQSASLGLYNYPLVIDGAPHVGDVQTGLLRHIDEVDRRRRGIRYRGFDKRRISPFPERCRKCVEQRATEHKQG